MISSLFSAILFGLSCAIIGCATHALQNEQILNWWFVFGEKFGKRIEDNHEKELWFYRPIWGCAKCFSGQLSMYWFISWHTRVHCSENGRFLPFAGWWVSFENYSLFCHILAIASAILSAIVFTFIIESIKKHNSDYGE